MPFKQLLVPLPHTQGRHSMWIETCGEGKESDHCVVILHGGPGYHTNRADFEAFASGPSAEAGGEMQPMEGFVIVRYDQRFCGNSRPSFEPLERNDRQGDSDIDIESDVCALSIHDLIADLRFLIVDVLKRRRVCLSAHSWATTLALAFAATHPELLSGAILFGTYLADSPGHDSVYGRQAVAKFPECMEVFLRQVGLDPSAPSFSWKAVYDAYRPHVLFSPASASTASAEEVEQQQRLLLTHKKMTTLWLLHEDYVTADNASDRQYLLSRMLAIEAAKDSAEFERDHEASYRRLRGQSTMQHQLLRRLEERDFDFLGDARIHNVLASSGVPLFFIQGAQDDCCPAASVVEFVEKLQAAHDGAKKLIGLSLLKSTAHGHDDAVNSELLTAAMRIRRLAQRRAEKQAAEDVGE
jgi:pimeloyl-ACP methyl ester carboxylesterase